MCTLETCTGDFTTFSAQNQEEQEKSLLLIPLSHLCTHQDDQSVFLPSYLPQDYVLFNLQLIKIEKNITPCSKFYQEDKNESLWCFSLSVGYGPRTDRNLLVFANQLCSINIPTIKNENKEAFKYTNTRTL